MIIGLGSDLCDIRRVEKSLERYGERFLHRCYTEDERARGLARTNRPAFFAKRFAVKEACAKALGTGFQNGVYMRDIHNGSLPNGKPFVSLTGGARARLEAMRPPGFLMRLHTTITDEHPLAFATVFIEAEPEEAIRRLGSGAAQDWL